MRTADGASIAPTRVVLAAGAWSAADWLPPEARPPVRPVKGQILTLAGPAAEPAVRADRRSASASTSSRGRTAEVVVGATVEERGFDTRVTAGGVHELLREAYRALPEIAELELVECERRAAARRRPTTRR